MTMQEEMLMKFLYSGVIVGATLLVILVFVLALLFYLWIDSNVKLTRNPKGYIRWMLVVYKVEVICTRDLFIYWGHWDTKKLYTIYKHATVRRFWETRVDSARQFLRRITPWPVYYWHIERDCDHYWVERAERWPNGWVAQREMMSYYDSAEGPCSFTRLTRREYMDAIEAGPVTRDAAAEAMGY